MGPTLPDPSDDSLKAKLLEQLMDSMDDRISKGLPKKDEPAEPPADIEVSSEANGDDLDADDSIDPALRDLIRSKRGA